MTFWLPNFVGEEGLELWTGRKESWLLILAKEEFGTSLKQNGNGNLHMLEKKYFWKTGK